MSLLKTLSRLPELIARQCHLAFTDCKDKDCQGYFHKRFSIYTFVKKKKKPMSTWCRSCIMNIHVPSPFTRTHEPVRPDRTSGSCSIYNREAFKTLGQVHTAVY